MKSDECSKPTRIDTYAIFANSRISVRPIFYCLELQHKSGLRQNIAARIFRRRPIRALLSRTLAMSILVYGRGRRI